MPIAVCKSGEEFLLLKHQQLEIGSVKCNLVFTRNLIVTVMLVTVGTIGLNNAYHSPETVAKQQRFLPIERAVKMGVVVKLMCN
ncbi:MAG TPA: hypothetical protein V6C95_05035 [Coleofasciculaceae cyanobacterium]